MKKSYKITAIILTISLLALTFAGCTSKSKEADGKYEVSSASDFASLGISLNAPQGSESIKYYVIDSVAQITFAYKSVNYKLRAEKVASSDISNIDAAQKTLKDTLPLSVVQNESDSISFYSVKSGGILAVWGVSDTSFSLSSETIDASDDTSYYDFIDFTSTVAQDNVPANAGITTTTSASQTTTTQPSTSSEVVVG